MDILSLEIQNQSGECCHGFVHTENGQLRPHVCYLLLRLIYFQAYGVVSYRDSSQPNLETMATLTQFYSGFPNYRDQA